MKINDEGLFKSFRVLFLCEWFPDRNNSFKGLFVQKHAEAIGKYCQLTTIYTGSNSEISKNYKIEVKKENSYMSIMVYYKPPRYNIFLISKIIKVYKYYKSVFKAMNIYRNEFGRPHLIHVNVIGKIAGAALFLNKLKNIPYVITEHWTGYLPQSGKFTGFFRKLLTKWVVKNAKKVITVSNNLKHCMKQLGLNGDYIIIPNVINTEIELSKKRTDKIIALNVSDAVDKMKNISGLIKATKEIIYKVPYFELHLVTEGKDKKELIDLAKKLDLFDKHVFFFEYMNNVLLYKKITDSSFVVINSRYETFSVVAAEALACGTPVLTTRCGGPEEFITPESGLIIEVDNSANLITGLEWMSQNYNCFKAEKLKSVAKIKFSAEVVSKQFLNVYKNSITLWKVGNSETSIFIDPQWKVLDVGSGNRPHDRADVLLEKEIDETPHRSGLKAVLPEGKKLIIGDALQMPFEDKEFDFIIASHIAEHVEDPEKFCNELSRVGRRGYIETPGIISEYFFNEQFHSWIVSKSGDTIVFRKKKSYKSANNFFYRLFYLNTNRPGHEYMQSSSLILIKFVNILRKIWKLIPFTYTKFHWEGNIKCKVIITTND